MTSNVGRSLSTTTMYSGTELPPQVVSGFYTPVWWPVNTIRASCISWSNRPLQRLPGLAGLTVYAWLVRRGREPVQSLQPSRLRCSV